MAGPSRDWRRRTPPTLPPSDEETDATTADDAAFAASYAASLQARAMRSPAAPSSSQHGFLRKTWDVASSPLRAISGLTGGTIPYALRRLYPEAYAKAAKEQQATEAEHAGATDVAGLPGVGDIATANWEPESLSARLGKTALRIGGNILGDPTSYVGAGIISRIPKIGRAVQEAQAAYRVAEAAGDTEKAAEALKTVRTLALELGKEEGRWGAGARRALETAGITGETGAAAKAAVQAPTLAGKAGAAARVGATLPFSPLVGVAYAPELVEGVAAGAEQSIEDLRAGRYAEAAASAAGTMLTTGLGALVMHGTMTEARAAGVLEQHLAELLGEKPRPVAVEAGAEAPGTAQAAGTTSPLGEPAPQQPFAPPPGPPGTQTTTPPVAGVPPTPGAGPGAIPGLESAPLNPAAAAAAAPVPELQPDPRAANIQVQRNPLTQQALTDLIEAKAASGEELRAQDLVDAGLVSAKQKKKYTLDLLLDALGGTAHRPRLERVPGGGFRVRAAEQAVQEAPGAPPAAAMPTPGAAAVPPADAPAAAAAAAPEPAPAPAPAPAPLPHPTSAIQAELDSTPGARESVVSALGAIAESSGKSLETLTKADVAAAVKDTPMKEGETPAAYAERTKAMRAVLYHVMTREQRSRVLAAEEKAVGPAAATTIPGLTDEPAGALTSKGPPGYTPPELRGGATKKIESLGLTAPRDVGPHGIGEPEPPRPPRPITDRAAYDRAREELDQMRTAVADPNISDETRIALSNEFADRDAELVAQIQQAIKDGVHVAPMPERAPAPEPERPVPYEGPRDIPATRPRVSAPEIPAPTAGRAEDEALASRIARGAGAGAGVADEATAEAAYVASQESVATVKALMQQSRPGRRSGLGKEPPLPAVPMEHRVATMARAIGRRMQEEGIPDDVFNARVTSLFGVPPEELGPEHMSVLFSLLDYKPSKRGARPDWRKTLFGKDLAKLPTHLDPILAEGAARRLTGGMTVPGLDLGELPHLARERERLKEEKADESVLDKLSPENRVRFDPRSPAGQVQAQLGVKGLAMAEDDLQDTLLRWVAALEPGADERHLARAEATRQTYVSSLPAELTKLRESGLAPDALKAAEDTFWSVAESKEAHIVATGKRKFEKAQRRRQLLIDPASLGLTEAAATSQIAKLLHADMRHKRLDYFRVTRDAEGNIKRDKQGRVVGMGEGARNQGDETIVAHEQTQTDSQGNVLLPHDDDLSVSRSGLTPDEAERLASKPVDEVTAPAKPAHAVAHPLKPAETTPAAWLAQVALDEKLRHQHYESLAAMMATAKKNVGRAGFEYKAQLDQMERDFGVTSKSKDKVNARIMRIARRIKAQADASSAFAKGSLLTDQLVAARGPAWTAAETRGLPVGDTGARVVDFEGDATSVSRAYAASVAHPVASVLSRVLAHFASVLGIKARLGGFTLSPQLSGAVMRPLSDQTVYINHLHAHHVAAAEVAFEGHLTGKAAADEIDARTAKALVDTTIHELAHRLARHDEATGDADFIKAYEGYVREIGAHYADAVKSVTDSLAPVRPKMGPLLSQYKETITNVARTRDVAGAGEGGAKAAAHRPGGGPRGPDGGAGSRAGSDQAVRGGAGGEAAGAGAAAAAVEGAAGRGAGGGGRDRGPGGDRGGVGGGGDAGRGPGGAAAEAPSASLTDIFRDLVDGHHARLDAETAQLIARRYATMMARHAGGDKTAADAYLRMLQDLKTAPGDIRAALRTSGPGKTVDTGWRLAHYGAESMSDDQREQLGLALLAHNHLMSRAKPMTEADVDAAARKLLGTYTVDEFVDRTKLKGIRDPAEWALIDSASAIFTKQIDDAHILVSKAQQDLDAASFARREADAAAAKTRLEEARGLLSQSLLRRDDIILHAIGESTNVARMLAFRKGIIRPLTAGETYKARFLGMLRASGIKKPQQEAFYEMLQDTISGKRESSEFLNAFRRAIKPSWFDKFLEFWKAGLLGLPTQAVNVSSNLAFLGLTNAEKSVSSLASHYLSGLTGAPRTRMISETSARILGGRYGVAEAWGAFKQDLGDIAHLRPPDVGRRFEMGTHFDDPNLRQLYGAIGGAKGEFIRIPFKFLDAADNFFKHIIRNQEWAAQADRLAQQSHMRSPGEAPSHATARIYSELRALAGNPIAHHTLWMKKDPKTGVYVYREAVKAGRDVAVQDTFQEALVGGGMRKAARAWQETTQNLPIMQFLTPFIKTPYNIIAEAWKRMPMMGVWAIKKRLTGELTDDAFVEATIKSAIGTSVMAMVFQKALEGEITGSGPADPKEAELLKRTGWQPRSIKINGTYYSYARFAPFSIQLGIAADMADAYAKKDTATAGELIQKGIQSASNNITDQSFLTGADNFMKLATDPLREGPTVIRQFQASLIPNIVGVIPVGHAARALDPVYRETEAFTLSPFKAQIPGLSQTLQPQYGPTGEPRLRKGNALERLLSPVARSPEQTDEIAIAAGELSRLGHTIESPPLYYRVGTDKVYYSPEERDAIGQAQQKAMIRIARLVASQSYQRLPDDENVATRNQRTKRDAIQSILNGVRRPVVERVNRVALRRAKEAEA